MSFEKISKIIRYIAMIVTMIIAFIVLIPLQMIAAVMDNARDIMTDNDFKYKNFK